MSGKTLKELEESYKVQSTITVDPYLGFKLEIKICNGNLVFLKLPDNRYYSKMEISSIDDDDIEGLPINSNSINELCRRITEIQYDK